MLIAQVAALFKFRQYYYDLSGYLNFSLWFLAHEQDLDVLFHQGASRTRHSD